MSVRREKTEVKQKMEEFKKLWDELKDTKDIRIYVSSYRRIDRCCIDMRYSERGDADELRCLVEAKDNTVC